ncbi:MAG: MFS transporter [Pseudomonadota bacterium]
MTPPEQNQKFKATPFQIFCWCVFDWAHSPFFSVIITFVFSNYFVRAVAPSVTTGTMYWGWAIGIGGVLTALLSPVIGAIADYTGSRKIWLSGFCAVATISTALLWFTYPHTHWILWGLTFVVIAQICFELAQLFYNAIMAAITPSAWMGRVSGWGWGLGYIGGIFCLVIALFVCIKMLPHENSANVRSVALLVAAWFLIFSLPLMIFTPDRQLQASMPILKACRNGLGELWTTFQHARHYQGILLFLLAHLIYTDGLNTLFSVGGTFAGGTFNMSFERILLFAITLNVTAGIGAMLFAWVDDYISSKFTIIVSLIGLIVCGMAILFTYDVLWFWIFSCVLGIFVGPTQAASRSYMAHISPPNLYNQMFGLYNFSGKISSFSGPFIFAILTGMFHSQRAGMSSIVILLVVGLLILFFAVPNAKRAVSAVS